MSPDGRLVVVPIEGPTTSDLWQYDISREAWRRLTSEKDNLEPLFSPDGRHIAFASNREGPYNLYRMAVDGTAVERLATSDHWQWPASWSPDGRTLIFMEPDPETNWDIWALPLDGERKPKRIIATRFDEGGAALSPDGRWLAYTSNESGRNEVYARPWPGPDRKWLVSTGGGFHPVWARNGRSLFYSTGERLMEVKVTAEAQFRAGQPRLRFAARFADAGTIFAPPYDIAPDGQRFVASLEGEATKERVDIVAVPDWFEELKARVPAPSR
jgi:serine/threonine-protein kinase